MTDSSADRDPLDRLAEEFVSRLRRGEHPPIDDYAARHPELAEQVRELFPALVEMEQLKPAPGDHTGAFEAAADPTDPDRVGEFRILRRVGHGGMGVVYEAVQESLGRHVALKLLPAEAVADPKRLERFRREARAAARLHHTNIVPVFGVGAADGRHFYAMQFIPGHPLDAVITEVRRLKENSAALPAAPRAVSEIAGAMMSGTFTAAASDEGAAAPVGSSPSLSGTVSGGGSGYWATVARMGTQVADALAYAHGQGVLHRDIKPANLLLDPTGTVWVTDFGLAKSADADDLTHAGDIVGTLRYMAPERFEGAGDHRADVYALGLTLYELLTLRPAFTAENRARLVQEVTAANPPRPRSVNATIPRDLETIVMKATARDPAGRYQTAAVLADDLRRFLDGRTISARRAGPLERAWRAAKRAPVVAALLAAVVLVSVAGAAVSTVFALRADADRTTAPDREKDAGDAREDALAREREANAARRDADDRAKALAAEQEQTSYLLHVSRVSHAQAAAQEYRSARLRELLAEMTPKAGAHDHRGWEWHYLDRLAHPWVTGVKLVHPAWLPKRDQFPLIGPAPELTITSDGARVIVAPRGGTLVDAKAVVGPRGRRTGLVYDLASGGPPAVEFDAFPPGFDLHNSFVEPDGKVVVGLQSLMGSARVVVWDVAADRELAAWSVLPNPVVQVAAGGNRVAVLSDPNRRGFVTEGGPAPTSDVRLEVWERGRDGPKAWTIPSGDKSGSLAPAAWYFAPDGTTLLKCVSRENPKGEFTATVEFWDVAGEPRLRKATTVPGGVWTAQFSAGGAAVAFTAPPLLHKTVTVYAALTGEHLGTLTNPRPGIPGAILAVAVSDDGRRVVAVLRTGEIAVGDREDAAPPGAAGEWRVELLHGSVVSVGGFLPAIKARLTGDGSRLVVVEGYLGAYSWNLRPLPGYAAAWPEILATDGVQLGASPVGRGERVLYLPLPQRGLGGPVAPSAPLVEYDPVRGAVVSRKAAGAAHYEPDNVSPDGRRVLVHSELAVPEDPSEKGRVGKQKRVRLRVELLALDRPDAPVLRAIDLSERAANRVSLIYRADFSHGGRWVVAEVATYTKLGPSGVSFPVAGYRLWAAETGEPGGTFPADPAAWGDAGPLVLSPDERRALVVTVRPREPGARTVRAFDPATGKEQWAWEMPPSPPPASGFPAGVARLPWPAVLFAPDGRRAAVADQQAVYLLDAETGAVARTLPYEGAQFVQSMLGRPVVPSLGQGEFQAVAFGPNGMLMIGTGRDAVIWDGTGAGSRRLSGHDGVVVACAISADGRRVFTYDRKDLRSDARDTLRVWDSATGRQLLTLATLRGENGLRERGLFDPEPVPRMWVEGDRLHLMTPTGVRVFDGTPRETR